MAERVWVATSVKNLPVNLWPPASIWFTPGFSTGHGMSFTLEFACYCTSGRPRVNRKFPNRAALGSSHLHLESRYAGLGEVAG